MDSTGYSDPEVAEMVARLARQQEEIQQARQAIEALVVKGTSRGREVVATMRGTGELTEVSIDPEAHRRYDAHDLGSLITEAVTDAQHRMAKAADARFAPVLELADRLT